MKNFFGETPDVYFGLTDGIDDPKAVTVDINPSHHPTYVADWNHLPFKDEQFDFSFWDPPYDKRYDKGLREIARVTKRRLAILHQIVYPEYPMLSDWRKYAIIGIIPVNEGSNIFDEMLLRIGSLLFLDDVLRGWKQIADMFVTTGPNMRARVLQVYDRETSSGPLKRKRLLEAFE